MMLMHMLLQVEWWIVGAEIRECDKLYEIKGVESLSDTWVILNKDVGIYPGGYGT